MKTLRFYKILIGILVVVNLTTVYFLWSSANGDNHPPHPKRNDLIDRLGITGDKKEQIMRLQDDHFKQKDALIQKGRELHEKLFLSFNDTSKDSTEIALIIDNIVENLVLTSLRFYEDPDTGDALFCSATLEQVTITSTRSVVLPKEVADKYKLQAGVLEKKNPVINTQVGVTELNPPAFDKPIEKQPFLFPYNPTDSASPFKTFPERYTFDNFPSGG